MVGFWRATAIWRFAGMGDHPRPDGPVAVSRDAVSLMCQGGGDDHPP